MSRATAVSTSMTGGADIELDLPEGSLVVLAGLPGAGKTTPLRRLAGTPGVRSLDSEEVAAVLRRVPLPCAVLRPLVHALHLLLVALGQPPCCASRW